jgi:tRNA-guanine transglycosylase
MQFSTDISTPTFSESSPALALEVHAQVGQARACTMYLPHGVVRTPVFMPVGTKGTIKGLSSAQITQEAAMNCEIILGNTYHLALQPGTPLVKEMGGLHEFMNWPNNLLTDSGGFQMVSLLKLAEITEKGVRFQNPYSVNAPALDHNKSEPTPSLASSTTSSAPSANDEDDPNFMMLTPEQSIQCQNEIGADIMMQLDDVVSSVNPDEARFREATQRSVRWLDRCIAAHKRPREQNLFGIIQGGLDVSPGGLREYCIDEMVKRNLPGYAIGGLAGGEDKDRFWRVVAHNARRLPADKPRYLMGVGYPVDLVVCVALGVDMFDCVYPTRTARFGVALTHEGTMRLKLAAYSTDLLPVGGVQSTSADPAQTTCRCPCSTCRNYTRALLHAMFKDNNALAAQLLTVHNIAYQMQLMRTMREAILRGAEAHHAFIRVFFKEQFPAGDVPRWVIDALASVNIVL